MTATPTAQIYLSFDGRCEAAFRFYEERLGATRRSMFPYGNSPIADYPPSGWDDKIMHGSITLGGLTIGGADLPPGRFDPIKGARIVLEVSDPSETERLFEALAENAAIDMPIQETFWSLRFGMLTDQFGVPWMISCAQAPHAG